MEAASFSLQTFPDPELEARIDSLIEYFANAQEEDGYLFTNRTIGTNLHEWIGNQRWELVHELSHELYNMGHLFEAAVAHYEATKKRTLLDIALKSADLICSTFGPGKLMNVPGHQEVELGLVKLYRITKEEKYLNTAKFFLDIRGRADVGNPKEYDQSHLPVTEQREAVGHSVRGAYMWASMADIAAITGDTSYMKAIDAIWHDIVDKKYYINGGIGATGSGEAFGKPYELPNMSAYCETCAGVGNAKWNHRMFLMHGDSKYIDVLERTMYNNILDGISLSGDQFFYPNPLASAGQHERQAWFGCACCPPNVARFLPSMPGYIYAVKEEDIYVNLYISSSTEVNIGSGKVHVIQESSFPWQGDVKLKLSPEKPVEANLKLRIPGYTINQPVPSDLYRYHNASESKIIVKLNGEIQPVKIDDHGYVNIKKKWEGEEEVEIEFPFEIKTVVANEKVKEDLGKMAIERGPLLYCAEWKDQSDDKVLSKLVDLKQNWTLESTEELGGIYTIDGIARNLVTNLDGSVSEETSTPIKLIPYHLWNNRGPGEMSVWLPYKEEYGDPEPAPTIARRSKVTSSLKTKILKAVTDQKVPEFSGDKTTSYVHWWPTFGTEEWVEFDLEEETSISSVGIFWYDDGPHGGCRTPTSWRVEIEKNGDWVHVGEKQGKEVLKDEMDSILKSYLPDTTKLRNFTGSSHGRSSKESLYPIIYYKQGKKISDRIEDNYWSGRVSIALAQLPEEIRDYKLQQEAYKEAILFPEKTSDRSAVLDATINPDKAYNRGSISDFAPRQAYKAQKVVKTIDKVAETKVHSLSGTLYKKAVKERLGIGQVDMAISIYEKYDMRYELSLSNEQHNMLIDDFCMESLIHMENLKKFHETEKKQTLNKFQKEQIKNVIVIIILCLLASGTVGLLFIQISKNSTARRKMNSALADCKEKLDKKNLQNETLLKEVHHRVKNNLQTISSLLYLQAYSIKDKEVKNSIDVSQQRVESIALIHKSLYQTDDLSSIEIRGYFDKLLENLSNSYSNISSISMKLDMEPTEIDVDTAIPLGLIVNELATNALKYAFPDNDAGKITLKLLKKGDRHILTVSDNSIGNLDSNERNVGSQLISILVRQIGGTMNSGNNPGYWCEIVF